MDFSSTGAVMWVSRVASAALLNRKIQSHCQYCGSFFLFVFIPNLSVKTFHAPFSSQLFLFLLSCCSYHSSTKLQQQPSATHNFSFTAYLHVKLNVLVMCCMHLQHLQASVTEEMNLLAHGSASLWNLREKKSFEVDLVFDSHLTSA